MSFSSNDFEARLGEEPSHMKSQANCHKHYYVKACCEAELHFCSMHRLHWSTANVSSEMALCIFDCDLKNVSFFCSTSVKKNLLLIFVFKFDLQKLVQFRFYNALSFIGIMFQKKTPLVAEHKP